MAQTYTAFLMRDLIPERAALQSAIKALGFKLTLEDDYVPFESSGYLPCTLDGEDAGFTIRFIDSQTVAGKDAGIILKSGGDPREETTIQMIAATLARSFNAVVYDKNNTKMTTDTLITSAKEAFAALD
ncbi:hypothetical protein GALL_20520 [mine drainage metagenome]|uniref:Uncharacterized protein n=1 Tax=mine drainage metagenome TaxID=410659 RepID=A0A1J5U0K9_9ZZZZ